MDKTFEEYRKNSLVWLPERGMGYYNVVESPYDESYFQKYEKYANTEMGQAITQARVNLVNKYLPYQKVLDVGIGCGSFVNARYNTLGYDINKTGIKWLKDRNLYYSPINNDKLPGITMWDVLEHIPEPLSILSQAQNYIFLAIPIFKDIDHLLRSKHYRKDEHMWYFTDWGLIKWMESYGFELAEQNDIEVKLGREDIGTFVFKTK